MTTASRAAWQANFNADNQLVTRTETGSAGNASETYTCSPAGELTDLVRTGFDAKTIHYGYDAFHRRSSQTIDGANTYNYAYHLNTWRRASLTHPSGNITAFQWDGQDLIRETTTASVANGGGISSQGYFNHSGQPLWQYGMNPATQATLAGTVAVYGRDLLGDITGHIVPATQPNELNPGMAVYARRFQFDAFGVRQEQFRQVEPGGAVSYITPTVASFGPGYKGQYRDPAGDLYLRHRYYLPQLGSFGSVDPAKAGSNWYGYCGGDPVNRADPSGLDWEYIDGSWKPIDGTPWVKPPPRWLTPEMSGSSRYGIIDHIAVRGAMRHPRLQQSGDVTVDEFAGMVADQRDHHNNSANAVLRIQLAYAEWDPSYLPDYLSGPTGGGEGVMQARIVDNIQAGGLSAAGGYTQALGYNIWNGFSLGGLGREDRSVGRFNRAEITYAERQAEFSGNFKRSAVDVALLATGAGAGLALRSSNAALHLTGRGLQAGFVSYAGSAGAVDMYHGDYGRGSFNLALAGLGAFGLRATPAAVDAQRLVHLTDDVGRAGITQTGTIIGRHGIFAVPEVIAAESTLMRVARTGVGASRTTEAVVIPAQAAGHFSRVTPIGPYSLWKSWGQVRYAPAGSLNLSTGVLTPASSLIGPRTLIYGVDAFSYTAIAGTAGAVYWSLSDE